MVTNNSFPWLLLVYSVPRHPSAARVHVWRRLKQLGAEALQDATWVLPAQTRTEEHLQWLASEIRELRGRATLWKSRLVDGDERALRRKFEGPVEAGYRALLAELRRAAADRPAIARRFQQLQGRDYFDSALGRRVRTALQRKGKS
ncbi:MAG: ChrB protein [Planctomycetes bacterium]|nr:ChrB protein [Planctomycetota bacterium]